MIEIELKVRVDAVDPIRERLTRKNAQSLGRIHEHDLYYNAPHRDFGKTDEAMRVRYTNDHAVITYKGAKLQSYGLKAREELNTAVESGEVFEQILVRLGFTMTTEVNKWRENYRLGNAAISLDSVEELGTFVEIEIVTEEDSKNATTEIDRIAKEIGVSGEPILTSYLELLLVKRSEVRS